MKKLITLALSVAMAASMAISASAATNYGWDFAAAQKTINKTVTQMIQNETFEITYDLDGGFIVDPEASPVLQTEYVCTDKGTHTVAELNPIRPMYQLVGWEYKGTIYQAGDEIHLPGNITLTAVWERR